MAKTTEILSSREAAHRLGYHYESLLRLVRQGVVRPSQSLVVGRATVLGWTVADVDRARATLAGRKPGPKGPRKKDSQGKR